jgi:hypothetical protein
MRARKEKPDKRVFIFKLTQWIGKARGSPSRILAIPEEFTLYQFAEEITGSFDFYFDHPFGFYNHMTRYYDATEEYELFADEPDTRLECPAFVKGVKKTRVNKVFTKTGKKMLFLFDYGDEWHFRVELLRIEPVQHGKLYPLVAESIGKARSQYGDDDDDEPDDYF